MKATLKAFTLSAGLLAIGCGGSDDDGSFPFPTPTSPPVAVNDSYSVLGNTPLNIPAAQGVLVNDTPNGATITLDSQPTTGTVTLNPDGSFTYTPTLLATNFTDTFDYTLTNSVGTSTATVTLNIGAAAYYVKNDGPNGNGSFASPFNNLDQAVAEAHGDVGAHIILFRGDGTANNQSNPVILQADETLESQDPTQPATVGALVEAANNTTVANLNLSGSAGIGLLAASKDTVTLRNLTISNSANDGLSMGEMSGTVTVDNVTIQQAGGVGFTATQNSGSVTYNLTSLKVSNSATNGLQITTNNAATLNWNETGSQHIIPAAVFGFGWNCVSSGTSNLNLRFNNVLCDGATDSGLRIDSINDSNLTVVLENSTIRNGADRGCSWNAGDTSSFKGRVSNTDLRNNAVGFGFEATSNDNSELALRFVGAISDVYGWLQNDPTAPFKVENKAGFNSENTGTPTEGGTISDSPVGSNGIP